MASFPEICDHPMVDRKKYVLTAPDGRRIEVPPELFTALNDFIICRKDAGSMVVHFRNGGVAGLETLVKKKYK